MSGEAERLQWDLGRHDELKPANDVEAAPQSFIEYRELSREAREVITGAQQERAGLLRRLLASEVGETVTRLVPFAEGATDALEAGFGETLAGEKLAGKARLVHGAVGVGRLAWDALGGVSEVVRAAKLAGKGLSALRHVSNMAKSDGDGSSSGSRLLHATVDFLDRNPELVEAAERAADFLAEQRAKLSAAHLEAQRAGEGVAV